MEGHEFDRPWQVMPAKVIKLALEHAKKKNDFDHQVAFLLLDIGVEAALKAYLVNRGHNVEKIFFPDLLKKFSEETQGTNPDFARQIDDIKYFHGVRNKLYHQGDGVKPTEDNLQRYSELASKIIEEILEVNLDNVDNKLYGIVKGHKIELKKLVETIEIRFKYFHDSCGLITEKARPEFGTREFVLKLKYIAETFEDIEEEKLEVRLDNRQKRIDKFKELTGVKTTNQEFIDYLLEDVNHLYVLIAMEVTETTANNLYKEYIEFNERRSGLLNSWKDEKRYTAKQVGEEYEKFASWLRSRQDQLDKWINGNIEDISWSNPIDSMQFYELLEYINQPSQQDNLSDTGN